MVRKPVENALILKELQRQTRKCQSACGSKKRPASAISLLSLIFQPILKSFVFTSTKLYIPALHSFSFFQIYF